MKKNEEEFESASEEEEEVTGATRPYNNQEGMENRLQEMKSSLSWLQHMDITTNMKDVKIPGADEKDEKGHQTDIQDDFKREMVFYCQAQIAAKEALSKLRDLDIPAERPEDYFAEMVKTDVHMQKIRQKLQDRKEGMEKSEKAKKQRQLKKIGKKVQQDVLQKRQQEKKKMLQTVDRIKKGKGKLEDLTKRKDDSDMFNVSKDDKGKWKTHQNVFNNKPKQRTTLKKSGTKRKHKDDKFGFGGKKRKVKKNSAESSNEMSSYKSHIHGKAKTVNTKKYGNKNSKSKPRLGKSRRMQSHGKNK